ncbi:uncharacterized protein [Nicotiana sylvestris]|uniref:uncharacterized protein n=1 Tax=Nicotiana sylvestris TaxID=4096 RepID=UPI00388CE5F4
MVGQVLESHKIIFHEDKLSPEGLNHNRALHITVQFEDKFIARVLVDGGSRLNICPLDTLKMLDKGFQEIRTENMNVKDFDRSWRATIGEINHCLQMGPTWFDVEFQVLDIAASYNLFLGCPWIHAAGAVPSTIHQVVKLKCNCQEADTIRGNAEEEALAGLKDLFLENEDMDCSAIIEEEEEEEEEEEVTVTCNEATRHENSDSEEEDETPREIVREVENFENMPKSNLDKIEEIKAKVIMVVEYPTWLANIVPVPKKDGKARMSSMIHHPDKNYIDPITARIHTQPAYCAHVEKEADGKLWFNEIKEY